MRKTELATIEQLITAYHNKAQRYLDDNTRPSEEFALVHKAYLDLCLMYRDLTGNNPYKDLQFTALLTESDS